MPPIHDTLAELHELVRERHPSRVSLSEHAVLCVDKALAQFSPADPDMDALRVEVRELHLAACCVVPPKPDALAGRLVDLAEKTDHDWMEDAPSATATSSETRVSRRSTPSSRASSTT